MTALATQDPAVAIAMAHCATARTLDPEHRTTTKHPAECGWCDYPADLLVAAIDEFNAWAKYDDVHRTTGRHSTRAFADLSPAERDERIRHAQALGDDPWARVRPAPADPEPEAELPPAHVEEVGPSWLG